DDRRECQHHQQAACLMDPFTYAEADDSYHHQKRDDKKIYPANEQPILREALTGRTDNVDNVLRQLKSDLRGVEYRKEPKIPTDEKSDRVIEPEFRPLVNAPLQR